MFLDIATDLISNGRIVEGLLILLLILAGGALKYLQEQVVLTKKTYEEHIINLKKSFEDEKIEYKKQMDLDSKKIDDLHYLINEIKDETIRKLEEANSNLFESNNLLNNKMLESARTKSIKPPISDGNILK